MSAQQDRQTKILSIRELPDKLEEAVKGLKSVQLDTPYRERGWTVRQVVHHLADSHMNAFLRMKWMVTEKHPIIKTYDQDVWASSPEYSLPLEPSLTLIRGLHERWSVLLASVSENDWTNKTANHPERGTVTLDSMITIYSDHGEKHCGHIWGLRKKMNW